MKTEEEIEKEFESVFNTVHPQIQEKLAAAAQLINEAEALAEEHGIPFRPKHDIMFCNPSYIPTTLREKFPEVEMDYISHLTEAYGDTEYGYNGWQQSQTC